MSGVGQVNITHGEEYVVVVFVIAGVRQSVGSKVDCSDIPVVPVDDMRLDVGQSVGGESGDAFAVDGDELANVVGTALLLETVAVAAFTAGGVVVECIAVAGTEPLGTALWSEDGSTLVAVDETHQLPLRVMRSLAHHGM